MSDALYKIGEEVECFCNKCGFFGKAKYTDPLGFPHPGCNYTASPLDGSARRIEALEADNAALREALARLQAEVMEGSHRKARDLVREQHVALATPSPGEKLLAERDKLREALKPFADMAVSAGGFGCGGPMLTYRGVVLSPELDYSDADTLNALFGQALDALKENGDAE